MIFENCWIQRYLQTKYQKFDQVVAEIQFSILTGSRSEFESVNLNSDAFLNFRIAFGTCEMRCFNLAVALLRRFNSVWI